MEKIKILIVDDEKLIREGLRIVLSAYPDLEVVGTAENGQEAFNLVETESVDVVLMDIRMPICDGIEGTKRILQRHPQVKILILTTFQDTEYIRDAINNGASGYLLKDSSYDLIHDGIIAALSGNIIIHPQMATAMAKSVHPTKNIQDIQRQYDLSEKELQIMIQIAGGLSNREIAETMYLSEGTVKNNISTILSKLSLRDRTQIAIFVLKNGLDGSLGK
ncbi:MAG: response regulator transcription factor [Tissierellia bacterium]|nr:response regulator transcription factor [Tissierellia bacterium]